MQKISLHILTFLLPTVVVMGCGGSESKKEPAVIQGGGRIVPVEVTKIEPVPFTETLSLMGTVKAIDDITLSAEEGGTLKNWVYDKGQYVRAGDTIAYLKDDVLKATFASAMAQYQTAQLNYEKQQNVYREQAVSEVQFKNSEYARDAAKAQAELMRARWLHTRIVSPVAGILDETFVEAGELAGPGAPVARVVKIARVKVHVNVPEVYAGLLTAGTPLTFTVEAYPKEHFKGKITYVGSTINPDNRTFSIEAELSNPKRLLKPGMITRTEILQTTERKALLVEESIVQQIDQDKHIVYVIKNGKAEQRDVALGARQNTMVEIVSGLQPGDSVVTVGYQGLVDKQAVTIANK